MKVVWAGMNAQVPIGDDIDDDGQTDQMAPPGQQPAERVIDLLRLYTMEVDRFIEVFSGAHGLHRTDLTAVSHIWDASIAGRPLTAGELSRLLSLSPAATTALIGRLEQAGHVLREHDTEDRRRVHLLMQPPAHELAVAFFRPLGERLEEAMADYDEKELEFVAQFIERMVTATSAAADAARSS